MITAKYIYWKNGEMWLGYLEEFPDYMTQGEDVEDLKKNLRDIYTELTSGNLPIVRRVAELDVA
jgi:predicted RNase H-like HicB family nuclease